MTDRQSTIRASLRDLLSSQLFALAQRLTALALVLHPSSLSYAEYLALLRRVRFTDLVAYAEEHRHGE